MIDKEELLEFYTNLKEKKEEGKKIIAYMSHDNIPEELIDAAGYIPLNLIFAGNDDLMNVSHDYLPPSTCGFAQSCIGLFSIKPSHFKFLDLIDYFIVSNHCVSNICAAEIITKYFDIPRLNFYVSYSISENSAQYFESELLDLKEQLENIKKDTIDDQELFQSIEKYNNFKKKLLNINNFPIDGKTKLEIFQKALLHGPDFSSELDEIINKYENEQPQISNNLKNLILTGCSVFINDFLIDLIEEGGGNVIHFDTWIGDNYFSQIFQDEILKSEKNPLKLLVHRFMNNVEGDHIIPNFLENKVAKLEKLVQTYKKQIGKQIGILNHIIKFCDHFSINSHFLKEQLQQKGIPVLNLERDYSKSARGPLETRIHAFLEML